VCSGESDYPFLNSSTLLSATVGMPYVGIPEADTLQSTMEQIICNCPWTWFYLTTRWPEGFTPLEEMISAN